MKMKLWIRAATVVTIVWLVGWCSVRGQTLLESFVAERQQIEFNKSDQIEQKSCEDWHNGKSQADKNCSIQIGLYARTGTGTDIRLPTLRCYSILNDKHPFYTVTDYQQFAPSQLGFVVASLLVIWGSFAMLQWLIRGRLL